MKRAFARAAAAVTALAAALAVAELVVRLLDLQGVSYFHDVQRYFEEAIEVSPQHEAEGELGRIFQNRPHVDLELATFRYRTDAHGFRRGEAWDYAPSETGRARFLFLGDSVTLAWGVDDDESWVRLLEGEGRAADGRPLRALNAGHMRYDTVQEASLLRALAGEHHPEVCVLTFVFNDFEPTWDYFLALQGIEPPPREGRPTAGLESWNVPVLTRFFPRLSDLLRFHYEARLIARTERERLAPHSYYPHQWPRVSAALEDVRRSCAAFGARLVVLDNAERPVPELEAWGRDRGVPRIVTRLTPEERALDVRNSPVDAHANARGNRLLADKALAGLRALGLLAP